VIEREIHDERGRNQEKEEADRERETQKLDHPGEKPSTPKGDSSDLGDPEGLDVTPRSHIGKR
jgi:hypothetical protein